ncbi:MAG: citrate/2-methylcitrate synthase, partial [Chloroflexota bacterium]
MVTTGKIELHRGLSGVYLDRTESCFIDGAVGKLLYRGYDIHDLAEKSTFEEVIHLLLYKKLPNRKELAAFDAKLKADRAVPAEVLDIVDKVKKAHP